MTKLPPQDIFQRLAVAAYGWNFYINKTLWPASLSPFYRMPARVGWDVGAFWVSGILGGIIAGVASVKRKHWPAITTTCLAYTLLLLPISGIFHAGLQITADRYSYIACMPWAILAGGGIWWFWTQRKQDRAQKRAVWATLLGCAGVLLFWMRLSWLQIGVWRDSEALWNRVLKNDPHCALALTNLGNVAMARHQSAVAAVYFDRALREDPDYPYAHDNRGILDLLEGRLSEGEAHFRKAIEVNPGIAESYSDLGAALFYQGDYRGAKSAFEQALRLKADYVDAYYNLGKLLLTENAPAQAIDCFLKALAIDPAYSAIRETLADTYQSLGETDRAVDQLQAALHFNPELAAARQKLENIVTGGR